MIVSMPDGTQVRFPDDMPREEIRRLIQSRYPNPQQTMTDTQFGIGRDDMGRALMQGGPGNEDLVAPSVQPQQPEPMTPGGVLGSINDQMTGLSTGATQGMTFGFADEIAAGAATPIRMAMEQTWDAPSAFSAALNDIRREEQGIMDRAPIAHTVGNVGGAVGTGMGLARGGYSLMSGAQPTATSMGTRGALEGALYGALHGAGSGETMNDRFSGAVDGALWGGGAGGVLGAGAGALANRAAINAAPSVDDLRGQAGALYNQAQQSGANFPQQSVQTIADDIASRAMSDGLDPTLHPGATAALRRLQDAAQQGMTPQQAQTMRRVLTAAARDPMNPDQARIASGMIQQFDDFVGQALPQLGPANQLYSQAKRGEVIQNAITKAQDAVGANYTSAGMATALRQQFKSLLNNKRALRGFSETEVQAIRDLVRGGSAENFLRWVGKMAPTGNISAATTVGGPAALGTMMGNPAAGVAAGLGLAGVGTAARNTSAGMTSNTANRISAMIRGGGPLESSPARQALIEAIVSGQAAEAPQLPQNTMERLRALIAGTNP